MKCQKNIYIALVLVAILTLVTACNDTANSNGGGEQGNSITPNKSLNCDFNDEAYLGATLEIAEVDENNFGYAVRAELKAVLLDDGAYFIAKVKDKSKTFENGSVLKNDNIEITVNASASSKSKVFNDGYFRFAMDVDGKSELRKGVSGQSVFVKSDEVTACKVSVKETSGGKYSYEYVYEIMLPYSALGLTEKPQSISFAWAVNTPDENVYVCDRTDSSGQLEASDSLWANEHSPQKPNEFYDMNTQGIVSQKYDFPVWQKWEECAYQSEAPQRYNYRGKSADDGLYMNFVQYVDSYKRGSVYGVWKNITHVETEVFNHGMGNGWGGTYFGFFMDGTYYASNMSGIDKVVNQVTVTDRGEDFDGYRYEISYEIYISFPNNIGNPDGPYAYMQLMSYTPGEGSDGYENAVQITKDGDRDLWKDDGNSYRFGANGISDRDIPQYADSSLTAYAHTAKKGEVQLRENGILYTRAYDTVAINDTLTLENGTYSASLITISDSRAGIVFGYEESGDNTSYYALYVSKLKWQVGLSRFENGKETVIATNYLSASFFTNQAFPIKVEIQDGKYYCYYFKTLYFTGEFDGGNGIGFMSDAPGAELCNVKVADTVENRDVDTLIVGHSYMELWSSYKQDLQNIKGIGNVYNEGIAGSVTEDWVKLVSSVQAYNPQLLVYFIGCNDLFRGLTVQKTFDNVQAFVTQMHAVLPQTKILLFAVNHSVSTTSFGLEDKIVELNALYKNLAENNSEYVVYVDVENAFRNDEGEDVASWFTDGLHPTVAGYKVIAAKINEALGNGQQTKSFFDDVTWPDWNAEGCVQSASPDRYLYRGFAANDGLYVNFKQFVDAYDASGVGADWLTSTHFEMNVYNHGVGNGWGGTYLAFFLDGTYYLNSNVSVTGFEYRVSVIDRGEGGEGFRYEINYEVYLGFSNNLENPQDGPYAYVWLLSSTPGETNEGYENSIQHKQDNRTLWKDDCVSYHFSKDGIVQKMQS